MAVLTDLPAEILEKIYQNLGSIDDVHYLARTCKVTCSVIGRRIIYSRIMRCVILSSPSHRFDVQLCRMLGLHRYIAAKFLKWDGVDIVPTPTNQHTFSYTILNTVERELLYAIENTEHLTDPASIPDEFIEEILVRWQGLRPLQELWLSKQLSDADYLSFSSTTEPSTFVNAYTTLHKREEDRAPYRNLCIRTRDPSAECFYTSFNADQKGRFHACITHLWTMNEIRWVLTNFSLSASIETPQRMLRLCMEHLEKLVQQPFLEHLDLLSMYTFLYQHLLPLHANALADSPREALPLTFDSDLTSQSPDLPQSARIMQLCLMAGQTYLQPPDIIDLVVRSRFKRENCFQDVALPPSTRQYVHAQQHNAFARPLPGTSPLSAAALPLARQVEHRDIAHMVRRIERSSFTGLARQQRLHVGLAFTPGAAQKQLLAVREDVEMWLKEKIETWIGVHCRWDLRQLGTEEWGGVWGRRVRWQVWWWAAGDVKAQMKFERWRREFPEV